MSQRLKLSVFSGFIVWLISRLGLSAKGIERKKGWASYSGMFENEVKIYLVNRLSSMASFEITSWFLPAFFALNKALSARMVN